MGSEPSFLNNPSRLPDFDPAPQRQKAAALKEAKPWARSESANWSLRIPSDVRALHTQVKDRFARVGIDNCHLDRAVLECLFAATSRSIENPLGYCIAVGRRLQDEACGSDVRAKRIDRFWIENACRHGTIDIEACRSCIDDRQRAIQLFPSLRRFLGDSSGPLRGRT